MTPMPITRDHRLAWRAATLDERLAACRSALPAHLVDDDAVRQRLARWARLYAGGDQPAFERRLAWDALRTDVLAGALAADPPGEFTDGWIDRLARLLRESERCAREYASPSWEAEVERLGAAAAFPFADVWLPLLRLARQQIVAAIPTALSIGPEARTSLDRQILGDLCRAGAAVLLEAYQRFSTGKGVGDRASASRSRYDRFVAEMLGGGLARLADEVPVLLRHLLRIADLTVEATVEMLARLAADRDGLAARFGWAGGEIDHIETGLSDPHDGRRRVMVIHDRAGRRIVYKPRDLRLEAAFNHLLSWLAGRGLDAVPAPLCVWVRPGYGWVEHAAPADPIGLSEAHGYSRKAGGLLCLAYLLRARDLHGENIVAAAGGPTLVDAEALVQPIGPSEAASDDGGGTGGDDPARTCLATGLLTLRHADAAGRYYDIGGLREAPARTIEPGRTIWHALRSDGLRATLEREVHPASTNVIRYHGVVQPPERLAEDMVDGFATTYRFLCGHRAELTTGPDAPLDRLAGASTRILFRPSDRYASLLRVLDAPAHWRHGVDRSCAFDALNRVLSRDPERPRLWPLVADERRALEQGDLPRFSVPTDERDIVSSTGERIAGYYVRSGIAAVLARLDELNDADLERQAALLHGALALALTRTSHATARAGVARTTASGGSRVDALQDREADVEPLERVPDAVSAAECIGRDVLDLARVDGDGALRWPALGGRLDLYGGAAGVAVLFAALATVRGARWGEPARAVVRGVTGRLEGEPDWCRTVGIGAATGIGSLVYGLTLVGVSNHDESALRWARRLAERLTRERFRSADTFDVVGGLAGAILALLALHAVTREADLLDRAVWAAEELAARQQPLGDGRAAWPGPDGHVRAGFAHGAAGAILALAELEAVTRSDRFAGAMARALDWERSRYSASDGNWPSIRGDGGTTIMTAWCHGAAGIAIGRSLMPVAVAEPVLEHEIRTAADAVLRSGPSRFDHLCCGTLARAEALLVAGARTGEAAWTEAARALVLPIARRIVEGGTGEARVAGFEHGLFQPGFFQGLSGIGYELLRVADPLVLPSVAGFDIPTRRR